MELENGITTADVPNLEASIPVNVTVGTLVSASHSQLFAHSSPNILFLDRVFACLYGTM